MLSEAEREYLKGELYIKDKNYRYQLDFKIKKKAQKALEDLTLVAEKHNPKQWNKIFKLSSVMWFIDALLRRNLEPTPKFKPKNVRILADRTQQWFLAWLIHEMACKRISLEALDVAEGWASHELYKKIIVLMREHEEKVAGYPMPDDVVDLYHRLRHERTTTELKER